MSNSLIVLDEVCAKDVENYLRGILVAFTYEHGDKVVVSTEHTKNGRLFFDLDAEASSKERAAKIKACIVGKGGATLKSIARLVQIYSRMKLPGYQIHIDVA